MADLSPLPDGEISQEKFDTWKQNLVAKLSQDPDYQLFLNDGLYKEWIPFKESTNGRRIPELHLQDPARIKLEKRLKHRGKSNEDKNFLLEELLLGRNSQLNGFIDYICSLTTNHCSIFMIKQDSTSFESMMNYLLKSHTYTYEPANIFDLSDIIYTSSDDYNAFYVRFREAVTKNIQSSATEYLKTESLDIKEPKKELLTPWLEEIIILWCLEKIDNRLPKLTKQIYKDKMNSNNQSLVDIYPEIFESIPNLLYNTDDFTEKDTVDEFDYITDMDFIEHESSDDIINNSFSETYLKEESVDSFVKNENDGNENKFQIECSEEEKNVGNDLYQEDSNIRTHYQCLECSKTFPSKKKLTDHSAHHKLEPCVCEFCDKTFRNRRALSEHISRNHKLTFACTGCDAVLQGQAKYEKHLKENHRELYVDYYDQKVNKKDVFTCRYCRVSHPSLVALKEHILQHKEDNKLNFTVEVGSKGGRRTKTLPGIKTEAKENICDICGKTVGYKYMEQHKKIHSTDNLDCQQCDVSFSERKSYLLHMRTHRKIEKTFSCDHCGMNFGRASHLKTHQKIHIVGEKLKCETCKRTFFDKTEMGSHVCKHHSCDVCGAKFLRARNLDYHRRIHFGTIVFSCDRCESLFLTKKRLNEHVNHQHKKEKKYVCEICDKRFMMKSGLQHHTLTHTGEKPFKCEECNMSFTQKGNLETHQKLHTDEMPYACSVCDAKFRQSGELKRHREVKKCGFSENDFYATPEDDRILNILHEESILSS